MLKQTIILFLITIMISCSISENPQKTVLEKADFFDVTEFLKKEITQLKSLKNIKKTVIIGAKKEEKVLEAATINWKEELKEFERCNLNKASYIDKYKVDTTSNRTNGNVITYTTLDPNLWVQYLSVSYENEKVNQLQIKTNKTNTLAESTQHLIYHVNNGYSILRTQKSAIQEAQKYEVKIEFK